MKKNIAFAGILFFIIIILLVNKTSLAQVTVRENDIVEKPKLRPIAFDSLSNLEIQKRPIDYKKYIGHKLFFTPLSSKPTPKYSQNNDYFISSLFSEKEIFLHKEGKISFWDLQAYQAHKIWYFTKEKEYKSEKVEFNKKIQKYDETIDKELTNIYCPKFYYQSTDKALGEIKGYIGTNPDSVLGRYFTIIDIQGKMKEREDYQKLDDISTDTNLEMGKGRGYIKFTLLNNSNNDTLFWVINNPYFNGFDMFFLVPYFEKQQQLYRGKNLVAVKSFENLIDVNTGEVIKIMKGEVWECVDISFSNSKKSKKLYPLYFLKKEEKEVSFELGFFEKSTFITENEFNRNEEEKRKSEEEKLIEKKIRELKQEQDRIDFKNYCIAKWGTKMGSYIAEGRVILGMNKEMCISAWGHPINVNRTMLKGLVSEQWVYGWSTYLYFDNGILTTIQD